MVGCLQAQQTDHVAGPAGSTCNTGYHRQGCYVTTGKPAMQLKMECKNAKWTLIEICAAGLVCVEKSDPTSPDSAMRYATCSTPTSKTSADASSGPKDASTQTQCGDAKCAGSENPYNCPQDCHCGDGKCGEAETPLDCPSDCHATKCGDGHCQAAETKSSCPSDCIQFGGVCGDGACGSSENQGSCPQDCTQSARCIVDNCDASLQQCLNDPACASLFNCIANCGSDGDCANSCGLNLDTFNDYQSCAKSQCGQAVPVCGNGMCEPGETKSECQDDCSGSGWRAGCTVKPGMPAGCGNCKCQTCVCNGPIPGGPSGGDSFCCSTAWDKRCTELCRMCGNCP